MCYLIYRLARKETPWLLLVFCWSYTWLLQQHGVFIQHGIFEAPEILPCGFERWSPVAPFSP